MKDNGEIAVAVAPLLVMLLLVHSNIIIPCRFSVLKVWSDGWEGLLRTYLSEHTCNNNQEAQTLGHDVFAGRMEKLFNLIGKRVSPWFVV